MISGAAWRQIIKRDSEEMVNLSIPLRLPEEFTDIRFVIA
jgi:hypothetical protein